MASCRREQLPEELLQFGVALTTLEGRADSQGTAAPHSSIPEFLSCVVDYRNRKVAHGGPAWLTQEVPIVAGPLARP